jgi:N-acetylglucosamine kinase-like BadF-type ATPase
VSLVLAVDGGNSKTIALVARRDGTIIGAARGSTIDLYSLPTPEASTAEIARTARAALAAAGATGHDVGAAMFALAGADWPEDYEYHRSTIPAALDLACAVVVENDAIGALRSGTPDGVGVAAVVGTGGAIGGRNAAGRCWHLGFWPDGMGGRSLGRAGVRAVYREGIGLDQPTSLTAPILAEYGVGSPLELLHAFKRRVGGIHPDDTARIAPIVMDEAAAGDPVALELVALDGLRTGEAVSVVAAHVGLDGAFPLVLSGGVLRHPAAQLHIDAILARVPSARPVRPSYEPAIGALLLAFDEAGIVPDEARLQGSLPAADLFATR